MVQDGGYCELSCCMVTMLSSPRIMFSDQSRDLLQVDVQLLSWPCVSLKEI